MKKRYRDSARFVLSVFLAGWLALPAVPQGGPAETGLASWYGYPYHGRFAASGELFNMEELTAAHPSLPFNTMVRVVNLMNDSSVEVRITDRGPFVEGRIIDLSRAAAQKIGLVERGTAQVRVEVMGNGEPSAAAPSALATTREPSVEMGDPSAARARHAAQMGGIRSEEGFAVQTGAFRNRDNAERFAAGMQARYGTARLLPVESESGVWRVLAGVETTREGAEALCARIRGDSGENNAFVVRLDSNHEPDRPGQFPRPRGTIAADRLHPSSN
jgi:rare lipoprotein A